MRREFPIPPVRSIPRRARPLVAIAAIAAVVLALVGIFAARAAANAPASLDGGPSALATASGVTISLRLSPGPYFLGELVAAEMTIANHSRTTYRMRGGSWEAACGAALYANISGGGAPTYHLPVDASAASYCPLIAGTLHAGQTWRIRQLMPITATGKLTIQAAASFITTSVDAHGQTNERAGRGPFTHGWPAVHIVAAPIAPPNRTITPRASGQRVVISAPAAARAHLVYQYVVYCLAAHGPGGMSSEAPWHSVGTTTLSMPWCGGVNVIWRYAVGAPGYAIASGALRAQR